MYFKVETDILMTIRREDYFEMPNYTKSVLERLKLEDYWSEELSIMNTSNFR